MSDAEQFTWRVTCNNCPAVVTQSNLFLPNGWVELEITVGSGSYDYKRHKKRMCPSCAAKVNYLGPALPASATSSQPDSLPMETAHPLELPDHTPRRRRVRIDR